MAAAVRLTDACSTVATVSATIFASVPWFIRNLGTYGIGIFTPVILATALGGSSGCRTEPGRFDRGQHPSAAKGAAMITVLLIVGILFAVALADKFGRIKLQIFRRLSVAPSDRLLASFSIDAEGSTKVHADLPPAHAVRLHASQSRPRTRRPICWRARSFRPSSQHGPTSPPPSPRSARCTAFLFPSCSPRSAPARCSMASSSPRSSVRW